MPITCPLCSTLLATTQEEVDQYTTDAVAAARAADASDPACLSCRYFDNAPAELDDGNGYCRRRAPVFQVGMPGGRWPTTREGGWCGEHDPE